ncbi:MAG: M48 family metallopeptidase [Vicinamibacteria bacterium]
MAVVKGLLLAAILAVQAVYALSTFTSSAQREALARRHFSEEEIARGRRRAREVRAAVWLHTTLQLALLGWLASSGLAGRLAERAAGREPGLLRYALAVAAVAALCFVLQRLASFPFSVFLGHVHPKAWGLSDRAFLGWLADYAKALGIGALLGLALTLGFYLAARALPRGFWLAATAGSALVGVLIAYAAPLVIAPLFNRFTPLGQTPQAALLGDVRAMTERAGLPVRDVLVMDASRQGRFTNAYFAGFGSTRRIVLYDTLLASHTREETLSILAHEIGHWRAHHIAKGLALGTLGAAVGFFLLQWLFGLASTREAAGIGGLADPAGLPLLLLVASLAGFLTAPIQNAVSRAFEREADRAALELGGSARVFVDAERRLATDNLGDLAPPDAAVIFFATHPPAVERIAMAEAWEAGNR